ncbi:hypothetical protein [Frigoriglobus tundricola]|uniref:Uncharacterized protein n=1 Tax=Frigoriglobus tundricola TaxID=2774151 RepID=A0A6M5YPN4_9BACT|nr:hypothetical protein [Frigoriglobus tundricola]QJW95380.1 hypothetical protein FTUN_2929 [Frigoriglobus tundricola]
MRKVTRRNVIKMGVAGSVAGLAALVYPTSAAAAGALNGTYFIRCTACGRIDKVEELTANHTCENNRCKHKSVNGGTAYVVCPDGHWRDNKVEGITNQHQCQKKVGGGICGKQCKGPFPKPSKVEG